MFRKLKDLWSDWGGPLVFGALILGYIGMVWGIWYSQNHRTVDLGEGVEVRVAGNCWYADKVKETGHTNQFYASNELGFSEMSMEPLFIIVNNSSEPREVSVHSLSAWRVLVSGKVHLEPGQKFEFQIQGQYNHWYCWINTLPKKQD